MFLIQDSRQSLSPLVLDRWYDSLLRYDIWDAIQNEHHHPAHASREFKIAKLLNRKGLSQLFAEGTKADGEALPGLASCMTLRKTHFQTGSHSQTTKPQYGRVRKVCLRQKSTTSEVLILSDIVKFPSWSA